MKGTTQLSEDAFQFCGVLSGDGLSNQGLYAVFEATLRHGRTNASIPLTVGNSTHGIHCRSF